MGGRPYKAGQFAHSLRTNLYREHLGLLSNLDHDVSDPISEEMTVSACAVCWILPKFISVVD